MIGQRCIRNRLAGRTLAGFLPQLLRGGLVSDIAVQNREQDRIEQRRGWGWRSLGGEGAAEHGAGWEVERLRSKV